MNFYKVTFFIAEAHIADAVVLNFQEEPQVP